MVSDGKLKRFGRYLLLDHLVDGGMAKIYRARLLSSEVDRIVAIKVVRPEYSENSEFKEMFLDEIKLTFAFSHSNIAQIYDYGLYSNQLYTAMELVDGKNLKQFLACLKKKRYVFPIEVSVYIISQVCQGLHYAHSLKNRLSDKDLNIIHRDISPHNIMLSYDGETKIIDFGIAKSEIRAESTNAGTVKGKLSYLAPEYLEGTDLDHRYDQFTLGVTLWELLCSRKLFPAQDKKGLSILKLIQACDVPPPSHINPNVTKDLDKIVMKSLAKDRNNRFKDMDQLNRMLIKFLYSHYPNFNSSDISIFAKALFQEEIKRDRAKLFEFGKIDLVPYINDMEKELGQTENDAADGTDFSMEQKTKSHFYLCDIHDIDEGIANEKVFLEGDDKSAVGSNKIKEKITPIKLEKKSILFSPLFLKQTRKNFQRIAILLLVFGTLYYEREWVLNRPFTRKYILAFIPNRYIQNYSDRSIASIETNNAGGMLRLNSFKKSSHKLFINGKATEYNFFFVKLPLGKKHQIEVAQIGRKSFIREFILTKERPEIRYEVPNLPLEFSGEIYSSPLTPLPEGTILEFTVNGRKVQQTFPFQSYRVPAGSYDGVVKNSQLGIGQKIQFEVKEGRRTKISADEISNFE